MESICINFRAFIMVKKKILFTFAIYLYRLHFSCDLSWKILLSPLFLSFVENFVHESVELLFFWCCGYAGAFFLYRVYEMISIHIYSAFYGSSLFGVIANLAPKVKIAFRVFVSLLIVEWLFTEWWWRNGVSLKQVPEWDAIKAKKTMALFIVVKAISFSVIASDDGKRWVAFCLRKTFSHIFFFCGFSLQNLIYVRHNSVDNLNHYYTFVSNHKHTENKAGE